MIDLGFQGNKFSWCNNREAKDAIFARLDPASINHKWVNIYFVAVLFHLPLIGLDHAAILLNMNPYVRGVDLIALYLRLNGYSTMISCFS